MMMIDDVAYM